MLLGRWFRVWRLSRLLVLWDSLKTRFLAPGFDAHFDGYDLRQWDLNQCLGFLSPGSCHLLLNKLPNNDSMWCFHP